MQLAPCLLLALLPACAARAAVPGLSRIDSTLTSQVDGVLDRTLGKGGLMDQRGGGTGGSDRAGSHRARPGTEWPCCWA